MILKQFPRILNKIHFLAFGIGALFVLVGAAIKLFPQGFGSTPMVMRVVVTLLMMVWFGLMGCFVLLGFTALHTVRIGHGEIHVCLGRFVLRRIPAERVKTVGVGMITFGRDRPKSRQHLLVLSARTTEEMDEKGASLPDTMRIRKQMPYILRPIAGVHAAARAYLLDNFLFSLLWMEYSPGAEEALRENLKTAQFLL